MSCVWRFGKYVSNFRNITYMIFIYFQAAVSALLAVSVLYIEKNVKIDIT